MQEDAPEDGGSRDGAGDAEAAVAAGAGTGERIDTVNPSQEGRPGETQSSCRGVGAFVGRLSVVGCFTSCGVWRLRQEVLVSRCGGQPGIVLREGAAARADVALRARVSNHELAPTRAGANTPS